MNDASSIGEKWFKSVKKTNSLKKYANIILLKLL